MASVGRKDGEECVALTPSEVEDIVILSHKNNSGGSHNEKKCSWNSFVYNKRSPSTEPLFFCDYSHQVVYDPDMRAFFSCEASSQKRPLGCPVPWNRKKGKRVKGTGANLPRPFSFETFPRFGRVSTLRRI